MGISSLTAEAGSLFSPPLEADDLSLPENAVALAVGSASEVPFTPKLALEASAVRLALLALIDTAASFIAEIESDSW